MTEDPGRESGEEVQDGQTRKTCRINNPIIQKHLNVEILYGDGLEALVTIIRTTLLGQELALTLTPMTRKYKCLLNYLRVRIQAEPKAA